VTVSRHHEIERPSFAQSEAHGARQEYRPRFVACRLFSTSPRHSMPAGDLTIPTSDIIHEIRVPECFAAEKRHDATRLMLTFTLIFLPHLPAIIFHYSDASCSFFAAAAMPPVPTIMECTPSV